ncbi:MAG: PAS domain S-box protein [Ignavibacteriales bacterium]|nr:PAS domain S-box protein [Ignavibacteriales bacterium]
MFSLFRFSLKKFSKSPPALIFWPLFIISISLALVGSLYYIYQKEKIVDEKLLFLRAVADQKYLQINDWLSGRYSQLEVMRTNPYLQNNPPVPFTNPNSTKNLSEWSKALKFYYQYDNVSLVSGFGKTLHKVIPEREYLDRIDSIQCMNSVNLNSITFSDADDKFSERNSSKFYVPLVGPQNKEKNKYVLILKFDPKKTFNAMLNIREDIFSTLEVLLVKPFNDGIVYLNTPKFSTVDKPLLDSTYGKALEEVSRIKSDWSALDGIDYRHERVVAVLQKVPLSTWTLITKINKSELYTPVKDLAENIILGFISADLLFVLSLLFIWRKSILVNHKKAMKAELEKLKSEMRFDVLVRDIKNFEILLLDPNGIITSWNYGTQSVNGYSKEELIGKHFSIFYMQEERENERPAALLKIATEKGRCEYEGWRLKKNGVKFWAEVILTSLKDSNNEIYGFIKVSRDLTEKLSIEKKLLNSRDFHLQLFSDFPNPVWRSDSDGKCYYFNNAWLAFTGKKLEDELGDGWFEDIHPEDRPRVKNDYYSSFRKRNSFVLEYRLKNRMAEYKWIIDYGMPFHDQDGEFSGYIGSCYDIDERKKYAETIDSLLRISSKLYSSLEIDQILDALVIESLGLVNAECGFATIIDGNNLMTKRYFNKDHWEYLKMYWNPQNGICLKFKSLNSGYYTNAVANDSFINQELVQKYTIKQAISIPVFGSNGELISFFELHNHEENRGFNKEDINLLNAVAKNVSISIEKSLNYEQLRETERQLRNSETELRNLAAQIQYARETERQRIAREVHDELGQLFSGINLNILFIKEILEQNGNTSLQKILNELGEVKKMVDKGIQSVRDISEGLRSYVLEHLGLIPAIQEYSKEFTRISNMRCTVTSDFKEIKLNEETNIALYRIIQEALTNAMRHSNASEIKIKFSLLEEAIQISIEDNGIGFNNKREKMKNTFGLLGMKERALYIGGALTIENGVHSGTVIKVKVPMNESINQEN